MVTAMNSGSRPQAHDLHWTLTETPLGYTVVARSHGNPVVIVVA